MTTPKDQADAKRTRYTNDPRYREELKAYQKAYYQARRAEEKAGGRPFRTVRKTKAFKDRETAYQKKRYAKDPEYRERRLDRQRIRNRGETP